MVISSWQKAEEDWMNVKIDIQIGHPLEYYEDIYTHAVALEWDIRLKDSTKFDEENFKNSMKDGFLKICKKIKCNSDNIINYTIENIQKTQVYICSPMIYYGADLNGLFSAQVVPNDEFVSSKCGKKIFAFLNHIYEGAKTRPTMKIAKEIFGQNFIDYSRSILFERPKIWKRVYEVLTIGHEFGHMFFITKDTETKMNKTGEFKYIEEFKATMGGLVCFLLNDDVNLRMPIFCDIIKRSVSLIAWQKVEDVRAYYCEGLMILDILFKSGAIDFTSNTFKIDFSDAAYFRFKALAISTYETLAYHYANQFDAHEFLSKFLIKENDIYFPLDKKVRYFVEFYYDKFEKFGNEVAEN